MGNIIHLYVTVCTYNSKRPEILTAFVRNWARSLTLDDQHQGIDLANGATDGLAVLIAPDDVADFAKEQLRLYEL
jgi:hypothetical protein